jgi:protein TonB
MTTLALHQPTGGDVRRYGVAALAILLLHAALIAAAVTFWRSSSQPAGVTPLIEIDLAPAPVAPQRAPEPDVPPGPEMQEAEPPPPEPPKPELIEQLPPTPVQPEPVVAAPPKVEPKPEPKPAKPQPVREVKQPTKKPPAPRTTAPPKAERAGPETQSTATGASAAAARANYASMLNAHLARFKQALSANDVGTAYVQFTVSRNGRLTARGLSRSSGSAVIDRAALDLLQRAQPLPPFPPDMPESSKGFSVPIRYR